MRQTTQTARYLSPPIFNLMDSYEMHLLNNQYPPVGRSVRWSRFLHFQRLTVSQLLTFAYCICFLPLNKSHFDELFLSGSSDQCFLVSKTKELFLFLSVYNKGIDAMNKIYYPTIANADKILQLSWPMSITTFHHLSQ